MKNALDICEPYFEHLELYGPGNLQVLGGVGSAALSQPDLVVDFEARELSLVTDLYLPQYRDGGSKRDLDVLVLSTDQAEVDEAKRQAFVNIGKELELSFFGLKHHSQLNDMAARPVRSSLKSFVGDRYVTTNPDGTIATQVKTLYPFMVPVDVATLETWTLLLHNPNADRLSPRVATLQVPIPHPAVTILNYATRSISGLRPKDAPKVDKITANVLAKAPEIKGWIYDGPGQGLLQMARLLQGLRSPILGPLTLRIGDADHSLDITPGSRELARQMSAVLLENRSPNARDDAVNIARAKSRVLHAVEKHPLIVDLWQKLAEGTSLVDKIIKNN